LIVLIQIRVTEAENQGMCT